MFVIILRTAILYIFVTIALRVMGKRQVGEMQPNELVVTFIISELAALPMQDLKQPMIISVLAISTLVILELVITVLIMKSYKTRRAVVGKPAIVIKDGIMDQKLMRALRLTTEDLLEDLRLKGVFNLENVNYAIVETNGQLSILQKPEAQPATSGQLGVAEQNTGIPLMVLSDGVFQQESLQLNGYTEQNIRDILNKKGLSPEDVFVMTIDKNGQFFIVGKEKSQ